MINPEKYVIKHIVNIHKSFFMKDYVAMVEEVQKDAYNQAIHDSSNNVQTKQLECFYDGVRSGGNYYITVIDNQSILKLLK